MSAYLDDDAIVALARERRDVLVDATRRLVRIDSQTPPSDTREVARLAAALLSGMPGVEVDLLESRPPVTNLVARLRGGEPGPRLILNGHLDTFPVGEGAWTVDPLGGTVADGRLYGRGSADMKGGCVSLIETMRLFAERFAPFPGEIVLTLVGDEERMGELGTQWLIDTVPDILGDGVIVADVGGPQAVRLGEKGMIWLEVEASGRQVHGAFPHLGDNALERLMPALAALKELEAWPVETPIAAAAAIDAASGLPGAEGEDSRRVMRRLTVNLGRLEGGTSPNLVPARAHAGLDIRIPLGLTVAQVEAEIENRLAPHGVAWTATRRYEPSWTSRETPIARACLRAAARVLDQPVFPDMRIGGSDARLWRRAGLDSAVHGLSAANLGAPDEYLAIDELWRLLAIHCLAARHFLYRDGS